MKIGLLCLFFAISLLGQSNYAISTVAGQGQPLFSYSGKPATAAQLVSPGRVVFDPAGNLYLNDDWYNQVYRVDSAGKITVFAGSGVSGFAGDGGPAIAAQLSCPEGLASDAAGNIYIADACNNVVRKVDLHGAITTVAGTGDAGFSGDKGAATKAALNNPVDLTFDSAGNLYIVDRNNQRIRKVDTGGIITTVAGNGTAGFAGDGLQATAAQLNWPEGVVVDARGWIYIADTDNGRIRVVNGSGVISTQQGVEYSGTASNTVTTYQMPAGMVMNSAGDLFFAESWNERIRMISHQGVVSTVAGNGVSGNAGDGGLATNAQLNEPYGLAIDSSGRVYIADWLGRVVRRFTVGSTIEKVAGLGSLSEVGDGSAASAALLFEPSAVALGPDGRLYIADATAERVRRVENDGSISSVAGNGTYGFAADGGKAVAVVLNDPRSLAFDASGNLLIGGAYVVHQVDQTGTLTSIAGSGDTGSSGDYGPALKATFGERLHLATDGTGILYIADADYNRIRMVDRSKVVTTITGDGTAGYSNDTQPARTAEVHYPYGVAFDAKRGLYFADEDNHRVRRITLDGTGVATGIITTIAGTGKAGSAGDGGQATQAQLNYPTAVALDADGNVYIADAGNYTIRKVTTDGIIHTIAGDGTEGFSGDGGLATAAHLGWVQGLAVDANGALYIADSDNYRVRKIEPAQILAAGVVNAASMHSGAVAPGEMVTLYGSGIGPAQLAKSANFETSVSQTRVLFDGVAAPLIYVSAGQTSAIVPYAVFGKASTKLQVEYNGKLTNAVTLPVAASSPALFTLNNAGTGQAAVLNQDWSLNGSSLPASQGSIVMLFGTGEGQTSPGGTDGKLAADVYPAPLLAVTATVGGLPADVKYAGAAPGAVAGLLQVNVQIPDGVTPGNAVPVTITIGKATSPAGVTLAVK